MSTRVATLYNANVYMNGNSYAGRAKSVTAPDLKAKMTKQEALSMIGGFELPTGLDMMSMSIMWNSVDDQIMGESADFYNAKDIMIRANADLWINGSKNASAPVVLFVRGLSKSVPPLDFKHQENAEVKTEYNVTAYRLEYAGTTVFDVDFFTQKYEVMGVDMLADYRANLGL